MKETTAEERRLKVLSWRWFKYYKNCKDSVKRMELLKQYNRIAAMRAKDVHRD